MSTFCIPFGKPLLAFAMVGIASIHFNCASAQTVEILAADQISRDPSITEAQRLIGRVKLGHEDAVMTCDSAWRFDNGDFEVFGDVRLQQPPSTVMTCKYIKLNSEDEWAMARGDVQITDDEGSLEAPSLLYSVKGKRARYHEGGVMCQGGWTVTSQTGRFVSDSKVMELGGEVLAVQQGDSLRSDSMHWHHGADRYVFLASTCWTSESGGFCCERGDIVMAEDEASRRPLGWLAGEVFLEDSTGRLHGDSIEWRSGASEMWGNVRIEDFEGGAIVLGNHALRNEVDSVDQVHGAPARLRQIESADTLYLQALHMTLSDDLLVAHDSVVMEQTDMVGQGDSLVWRGSEDQIRLFGNPMMWNGPDELSGDSLKLLLDDQAPRKMELRGHALVLSPANDTLTHSIEGRTLDAHFEEGELSRVDVLGNGVLVHFEVPEDSTETVRINRAQCAEITMHFESRKLVGIRLKNNPQGKIAPFQTSEHDPGPALHRKPTVDKSEFPSVSRAAD